MKFLVWKFLVMIFLLFLGVGCYSPSPNNESKVSQPKPTLTAADILGRTDYLAISYGGYRQTSRNIQPTVAELKEDMKILSAMGIRILRTYNTKLPHATNVLKAIQSLKKEDPNFEMYVMLGAWIDCKNAWTDKPNHDEENEEANTAEIQRAVRMATEYPDIVKIIAVGNEAMVKWAASYYVSPKVILKWVNFLQGLKTNGELSKDLWITSSDNFASWGGGDSTYHTKDLTQLIKAVDYISMHTYPMHDTHYNPNFWGILNSEKDISKLEKIDKAMERSGNYAKLQYQNTVNYIRSLGVQKPVHIGETGWATASNGFYGKEGSQATDEYKSALYYRFIRDWTAKEKIACFYFEAFDEPWKDANNSGGAENNFGLFTVDGQAKYALWDQVDQGVFKALGRSGNPISKTYNGEKRKLLEEVFSPAVNSEIVESVYQ